MFFSSLLVFPALVVTAILVQESIACGSTRNMFSDDEEKPPTPRPPTSCGVCGDPIQFTLIVKNSVLNPKFQFNITLKNEPQTEMINLLEKAAQKDKQFEFSVSYHTQFGYFLTSIGGQASGTVGNYSYYWIMTEHPSGESLRLGMSTHVPGHLDSVLFNLTRYGH